MIKRGAGAHSAVGRAFGLDVNGSGFQFRQIGESKNAKSSGFGLDPGHSRTRGGGISPPPLLIGSRKFWKFFVIGSQNLGRTGCSRF